MSEKQLAFWLFKGMKLHMRWQEWIFDRVNIDDVVPRGDTCYDAINSGFHTVFNAWSDDPEYVNIENNVSIVTDGNKVLTRVVKDPSESALKKMRLWKTTGVCPHQCLNWFFFAARLR